MTQWQQASNGLKVTVFVRSTRCGTFALEKWINKNGWQSRVGKIRYFQSRKGLVQALERIEACYEVEFPLTKLIKENMQLMSHRSLREALPFTAGRDRSGD